MTEPHIHDCTGPDATCPCGYKFVVPRFMVSYEVYDNDTGASLIHEGFSTDQIGTVIGAFEDAVKALEDAKT